MRKLASVLSTVVFLVVFLPLAFKSATSPDLGDRDVRSLFMIAIVAVVAAFIARLFFGLLFGGVSLLFGGGRAEQQVAVKQPVITPPAAGLGFQVLVGAWVIGGLLCVAIPFLVVSNRGLGAEVNGSPVRVTSVGFAAPILTLLVLMTGIRLGWVNRRRVADAVRYSSPPVPIPAVAAPRQRPAAICPQCSTPLAADAPQGLCPRCLMKQAFAVPPASATGPYHSTVPPAPEEVAEFLPHLEILELLGQGGMGAVYKARQPSLDRLVALKLIRPRDDDPTFAERFAREAKVLARLDHPHVVRIHESGTAGGCLYLVMEFVDGVTLRQAMQAKSLTSAQSLTIVGQVCAALQYAHGKGVVHRDVKPENILLDKAGNVKIADFGLAKVADPAGMSLTRTNQAMGTPHYMAPEQWEAATVDHRADIYALGVVLYELLTGELPLGRFDPPSVKARVDARIDEIVFRALAKEPGRRFQSADDVRSALDLIQHSDPVYARPPRGTFYEYKSKTTYLGWPLVHVTSGIDPATGRQKTACGWIAVGGGTAVGGVAVAGGMAIGGVAVAGGGSVGVVSLAGGWSVALLLAMAGGAALGPVAVAGGAALGLFAVASASCGFWAIGVKATGLYVINNKRQDADFWDSLTGLFGA